MYSDPYIRPNDVATWLGVSKLTLWRWEKEGLFPVRTQLGKKAVGWRKSEIEAWMAERNKGIKDNPEHSARMSKVVPGSPH